MLEVSISLVEFEDDVTQESDWAGPDCWFEFRGTGPGVFGYLPSSELRDAFLSEAVHVAVLLDEICSCIGDVRDRKVGVIADPESSTSSLYFLPDAERSVAVVSLVVHPLTGDTRLEMVDYAEVSLVVDALTRAVKRITQELHAKWPEFASHPAFGSLDLSAWI